MSITSTLVTQMIVFLILIWFTMKFVLPPTTAALDERARRVADGLSAADKAKAELALKAPGRTYLKYPKTFSGFTAGVIL